MNPLHLIKGEPETRQEKAMREIRERRTGENIPQGEGEIDNTPLANTIDVDRVLRGSYRKTDEENLFCDA